MKKLTDLCLNLKQSNNGIWKIQTHKSISYPEDGNESYFEIEDDSFWFQHRNKIITQLVKCYSRNDTFFDVGGGNGCVALSLQSAGVEVVLIEPGNAGVTNARLRGVNTIIQSTLEELQLEPNSIPTIGLFDVLEHIKSDNDYLNLLFKYIKPNGYLYLTVPTYKFLWSVDDVLAGHYRRYTLRSLSKKLKAAGFSIEYSGYMFSFLVPPILFFRSLPSKLGIRKKVSKSTTKKEHKKKSGIIDTLLNKCLGFEYSQICKLKKIPLGSSCIVVAKKIQ